MERKPSKRHARTRSGAGAGSGGAGAVLASFLRSTAASFSSSTTNFAARAGRKSSFNHRNAFSGPMVSIVPPEARGGGGRRRGSGRGGGGGYRTPEASSPKVSCIGQIKRSKSKRKNAAAARKAAAKGPHPACGMDGGVCPLPPRPPVATRPPKRSSSSLVKRMLFRRSSSRSSSSSKSSGADGFKGRGSTVAAAPAPAPAGGLGQMKRFTSGRGAFQDFDWTEQVDRRGSDVDGADGYDPYEDEGFVAHSAPLVLGGGMVASEPRKEVNLWRRRPMSPPTPLQLP